MGSFKFYLIQETDVYVVLFNVLEAPKDTMKHVLCTWIFVAAFLHVKSVLAQCGSNGELCGGNICCHVSALGNTCCPSDSGYGCCPLEGAVCCSDGKHCCYPGMVCLQNGTEMTCGWTKPSNMNFTEKEGLSLSKPFYIIN